MGQKKDHQKTIGLCPYHHRLSSNESFHLARKNFEQQFGTELDLFEALTALLET